MELKTIKTAIDLFEAGERDHHKVKKELEITRDAAYYLRRVAWIGDENPNAPKLRTNLYNGDITMKEARALTFNCGRVSQSNMRVKKEAPKAETPKKAAPTKKAAPAKKAPAAAKAAAAKTAVKRRRTPAKPAA